MPRLFLFGIGGTGSRVIKSLTMLLASGIQLKNDNLAQPEEYELIPIIIDPDTQNGDMIRTIELLKVYQSIHNQLGQRNEGFFQNKISTLRSLRPLTEDVGIQNTFNLDFSQTLGMPFKEFISYNTINSIETKWFLDLLYTDKNLHDNLTMGFLGNPNVGSVVLNKLKDSAEFKFFGTQFGHDDRIFIVSSIFGGTGAAGFPLLVKHFRDPNNGLTNVQAINNSVIGAITIMPYFKVDTDNNCAVDSSTFITKTKAALSYYDDNLTGVNALYYIGDDFNAVKNYSAHDGGTNQQNNAHFIEVASALSVYDFIKNKDIAQNSGIKFFEYAINGDNNCDVDYDRLCPESRHILQKRLSQLFYLSLLNKKHIKNNSNLEQVWAQRYGINESFKGDLFYKNLCKFFESNFDPWLKEMDSNQRKFKPFNLAVDIDNLVTSINSVPAKTLWFFDNFGEFDYGSFDKELNNGRSELENREKKFMDLWWKATDTVVSKHYTIN